MGIEFGDVQNVSTKSGESGWGFTLKDSTARPIRFMTITYRTQTAAKDAREKMLAATANAIDVSISA